MSENIVFGFLALSIFAYGVTGGADFGVGILETLLPRDRRARVRALGEQAIAPVWEANHIWLIIALVICFVGYPGVFVYLTTYLHVPLLIMLVGIILRGTAFTFRYYDLGERPVDGGIWSPVFRVGSLLVPFAFGVLAATLRSGSLPARPTTVWETYFVPWLSPFPLLSGLFGVSICAWLAAVFLNGECEPSERSIWVGRARFTSGAMVLVGGLTTVVGFFNEATGAVKALQSSLAVGGIALATSSIMYLWWIMGTERFWLQRILVGAILGGVLLGYFGFDVDTAVVLQDHTRILWSSEAGPEATLRALAVTLTAGSLLILPGLVWLYYLFKQPTRSRKEKDG